MNAEQLRVNARIEDEHWWFVGRRRIMRALVERLAPPNPNRLIVDVGCGTGGNIGALSNDYRAIGIDTSPDAIELARARFPRAQFVLGRAPDDLGPAAGEASVFLLMDVLEHVRDDFWLFSELLNAATPGAHFLITVPADPGLWSEHDESHLHYRRYNRERLAHLWRGQPVTTLGLSYFNSWLYRPIQAVRAINRLRGKASGEAGTDLWLPRAPVNRLLTNLYAGETKRLLRLIDGRSRGFGAGVSLLAVLRREAGPVGVHGKPADAAPDLFDPEARRKLPVAV